MNPGTIRLLILGVLVFIWVVKTFCAFTIVPTEDDIHFPKKYTYGESYPVFSVCMLLQIVFTLLWALLSNAPEWEEGFWHNVWIFIFGKGVIGFIVGALACWPIMLFVIFSPFIIMFVVAKITGTVHKSMGWEDDGI